MRKPKNPLPLVRITWEHVLVFGKEIVTPMNYPRTAIVPLAAVNLNEVDKVPVTFNFQGPIIGDVVLTKEDTGVYATINLDPSADMANIIYRHIQEKVKLYPALAFTYYSDLMMDGVVQECNPTELSICHANIDPTVPPLKFDDATGKGTAD